MNEYKKLNIARSIFAFIIFVIFGVIIFTEKGGDIFIPKIQEKLNTYISTNYKDIMDKTIQEDITYKNRTFSMKIIDKLNKEHYFFITYANGKITDTYETDYKKGKNLLNKITKDLEQEIYKKTKINTKVNILDSLDQYTEKVQQLILNENDLINKKIYSLEINIDLKPWNGINASIVITNTLNKFIENNINPKNYTIIINNIDEITESIEIYNIDNNFVNNKDKIEILNDIINNKKSNLVDNNNITFKHLN